MSNFTEIAKAKIYNNSTITDGREKMKLDELIKQNNELTIINADIFTCTKGPCAVCVSKEFPTFYFFGGTVLTDIVTSWITEYQGDVDKMNAELEESGGVTMKFEKTTTRNGNPFMKVEII